MDRRIEIKKWLLESGITQQKIAEEAGVSAAMVSMTINGRRRSAKVVAALERHGCPVDLVDKKAA